MQMSDHLSCHYDRSDTFDSKVDGSLYKYISAWQSPSQMFCDNCEHSRHIYRSICLSHPPGKWVTSNYYGQIFPFFDTLMTSCLLIGIVLIFEGTNAAQNWHLPKSEHTNGLSCTFLKCLDKRFRKVNASGLVLYGISSCRICWLAFS